jgi:hypothetical protein
MSQNNYNNYEKKVFQWLENMQNKYGPMTEENSDHPGWKEIIPNYYDENEPFCALCHEDTEIGNGPTNMKFQCDECHSDELCPQCREKLMEEQ